MRLASSTTRSSSQFSPAREAADFPLLTDQNVRDAVVAFLRARGFDVISAREGELPGSTDEVLRSLAIATGRVVVTHDRDFGRLATLAATHPPGVVFIRPGHLDTAFTIAQFEQLLAADLEVEPPFLLVAEQQQGGLNVRLRTLRTER